MTPYYQDECCTIYHGDCRDVLPTLGAVDHVITDPPYARDVYMRVRGDDTPGGKSPGERGLVKPLGAFGSAAVGNVARLQRLAAGDIGFIDPILEEVALSIGKLTLRWCVVFSDVETCYRWRGALEAGGLRYVRTGAWVKPDAMPQMTGDRPAVGFEPATICHAQGAMRWNGGGLPALWTFNICKANRPDHPCPKPEPLMFRLVELFTDPGDLILDPFMGSGTTLVAAKRLGRKAIGIELNEKYCEIAVKRLAQSALPMFTQSEPTKTGELFTDGDAA